MFKSNRMKYINNKKDRVNFVFRVLFKYPRIGVFFILFLVCYMQAHAEYKPMLRDGRVWNLIEVYERFEYVDSLGNIIDKNDDSIDIEEIWHTDTLILDTLKYTYYIDGTETIGNRLCHKLYSKNSSSYVCYYEEGGKVYALENGKWIIVFDFTLEMGAPCPNHPQMTVHSVDTINVGGNYYKRLWFGYSDDEGNLYWIEGVGSTRYGPFNQITTDISPMGLRWKGLMSVYDGQTCIFEKNDLHQPGINTGIRYINNKLCNIIDGEKYNLLGHSISGRKEKGFYIENGRKYVKRIR